jgi:Transglycosylase-like domain
VTFVVKFSAAGARTAALGRHRRMMVAGSLSAALVFALSVGPVSADSIGSAQARADQVALQIASGAARIRLLDTRYFRASDAAVSTAAQLAHTKAQLDHIRRRVDAGRAVLRAEALTAYVGGRTTGTSMGTAGAVADVVVRGEYLKLAVGDATDALDQLRANAQSLQLSEAAVERSQQVARAAAYQVLIARQAALAEARRQQAMFDQVQGQLVVLVAAQQQALALAAARRSQPPQGLPVNGGLVSVVLVVTSPSPPPAGGVWASLRQCESSGNYAENTGNGYYGAYQFSQATWTNLGYPGRPDLEPPAMQDQAAQKLQAASGWGQWPTCAAALGLS